MKTFEDPETIEVAPGERFAITLSGNFTTGYVWRRTGGGEALKPVGEEMRALSDVPGAAGVQEFAFEASTPGLHVLLFAYAREWEPDALQERAVEVTVRS